MGNTYTFRTSLKEVNIAVDDKRTKPKNILNGILEQSTAHGLSKLASSRGNFKRIIWNFAVFSIVTSFLINMALFVIDYMSYEVHVNVEIKYANMQPFPAVTVCNMNPIKASALGQNEDLNNLLGKKKRRKRQSNESPECPNPIEPVSGKCFFLLSKTEKREKETSQINCQSIGSRLATLETQAMVDHVRIHDIGDSDYWINLYVNQTDLKYYWNTQEGSVLNEIESNWNDDIGSGMCIVGLPRNSHLWTRNTCSLRNKALCEWTTPTETTSFHASTLVPEAMTSQYYQTTKTSLDVTSATSAFPETRPSQTTTMNIETTAIQTEQTAQSTLEDAAENTASLESTTVQTEYTTRSNVATTTASTQHFTNTFLMTSTVINEQHTNKASFDTTVASETHSKTMSQNYHTTEPSETIPAQQNDPAIGLDVDTTTATTNIVETLPHNESTMDPNVNITTSATKGLPSETTPTSLNDHSAGKPNVNTTTATTKPAETKQQDDNTPELHTTRPISSSTKTIYTTRPPNLSPKLIEGSSIPGRVEQREDFMKEEKMYEILANMDTEGKMQMGYKQSEFILDCEFEGVECSTKALTQFYNPFHGNCYTFNSGWDSSQENVYAKKDGRKFALQFVLNIGQDEYLPNSGDAAGAKILVHPQGTMPYPEDEGYMINPGMLTSIGLQKVSISRLPDPYGECVEQDPINLDVFTEHFPVNYSVLGCYKTCYQKHIIKECSCADIDVPMTGASLGWPNVSACDKGNVKHGDCLYIVTDKYVSNQLPCNCPIPCQSELFLPELSTNIWPNDKSKKAVLQQFGKLGVEMLKDDKYKKNLLKLEVYFKTLSYKNIRELPSYSGGEFASDLGGTVSLWIGASSISVMEWFECSLDMIILGIMKLVAKR